MMMNERCWNSIESQSDDSDDQLTVCRWLQVALSINLDANQIIEMNLLIYADLVVWCQYY